MSQAGDKLLHRSDTVECNFLSLPVIPACGTQVLILVFNVNTVILVNTLKRYGLRSQLCKHTNVDISCILFTTKRESSNTRKISLMMKRLITKNFLLSTQKPGQLRFLCNQKNISKMTTRNAYNRSFINISCNYIWGNICKRSSVLMLMCYNCGSRRSVSFPMRVNVACIIGRNQKRSTPWHSQ